MKRWGTLILVGVALAVACALHARAAEDLTTQVLAHLSRGESVRARELLAESRDDLEPRAYALLDFACALSAAPAATAELAGQAEQLVPTAEAGDVPLLRATQVVLGPRGAYLEPLIDASYRAVDRLGPPRWTGLCSSRDERTRQLAVAAIASWLAPLRERVSRGGELDAAEQQALQDPGLIDALIARLPERAEALDRVPPELAAAVHESATAFHALVLIEEPALAGLHAAFPAPGTATTIAAIDSAINLRKRRFPSSTWAAAHRNK